MNENQVRQELQKLCDRSGGQRALARKLGISNSLIYLYLHKASPPGKKILKALGLRKKIIVTYEKVLANE